MISKLFLSYYANFCKNGNPNGRISESHKASLNGRVATDEGNANSEGLPQWTSITKDNLDAAPVMIIDVGKKEVASPKRRTLTARSRNTTEARRSNSV